MFEQLSEFHFIRPEWLLAIVPLLLLSVFLKRLMKKQSGWQGVIAQHLYAKLIASQVKHAPKPPLMLLFLGWLLACVALAGPTWERLPQPVYQLHTGKVVVMDLSMSMRSTDVKPDRLSRAKFKAIDLVKQIDEGEIGLIAYAGDAYVISPLTTDIQNLTSLIPSLSPEIMPEPGSEPLYAFEEAIKLLSNAGYQKGEIFWLTDGLDLSQVAPINQLLTENDYRLNILGIGTEDGAPIKLTNNELLKDSRGAIVIPKLETGRLQLLANKGNGLFTIMQPDDRDIKYLVQQNLVQRDTEQSEEEQNNFGDQWKEFGPYLLLLLLPIAAYGFRRGVLPIFVLMLLPIYSEPAQANWWDDLWQRGDQQGMHSFNEQQFADAAQQFDDPMWKGSASYRNGDYESAIEEFSKFDTEQSNYNLGNALAQTGDIDKAIEAYNRTLEMNPNHEDAKANKDLLEQLKDQQQQNQDQQNQDQQNQDQQNQDQQNQDQQNQDQQNQDQQNQDQQNQDQQNQDQQNQDQQNQDQKEQESQENDQQQQQDEQEQSEDEQQNAEAAQAQPEELTEEEKEQQQKMQNWLRKIPDDPAYLLKRKMQLEQERRKRQRLPSQLQRNW